MNGPGEAEGSVARSVSWAATEAIGQVGLSVASLVVLARILEPREFGLATLALVIVQSLNLLVEYLFLEAIVQKKELEAADIDTAFWITLISAAGCFGLCLAVAPSASAFFETPALASLLPWTATALVFAGCNGILVGLFRRNMQFKQVAAGRVLGRLFGAIVAIGMAVGGWGAWSLIGQFVGTSALSAVVFWTQTPYRPRFRVSFRRLSDLSEFAAPYLLGEAVSLGNTRVFPAVVAAIFGPVGLGLFGLATRVSGTLGEVLGTVTHQISMTVFSRKQSDPQAVRAAIYESTAFASLLGFPVFLGLMVTAEDLVIGAFGSRWLDAVPLVQLLALAGCVRFGISFLNTSLAAIGRPIFRFVRYATELIVGLALIFALAPFGVIAAGYAVALRSVLSSPILLKANSDLLHVRPLSLARHVAGPAAAAATMVVSVVALRMWLVDWPSLSRLAVLVVGGAMVYGVSVRVLAPRLVVRTLRTLAGRTKSTSAKNAKYG